MDPALMALMQNIFAQMDPQRVGRVNKRSYRAYIRLHPPASMYPRFGQIARRKRTFTWPDLEAYIIQQGPGFRGWR